MAKRPPLEHVNFDLHVNCVEDIELSPDDGPSTYVLHLPFEIRQAELHVGSGTALRLMVTEAGQAGYSPAELFDCVGQDVHELYCSIFDHETNELRENVAEPGNGDDVLYIRSIKVIPERRGQNLGLLAVQRLRFYFGGGCSVTALKAHPLAFDPDHHDVLDRHVFAQPFAATGEVAKAKLQAYWSQLGFRPVDDSGFMVFDMTSRAPLIAGPARG